MKFLSRLLSLVVLAGLIGFYAGCDGNDPEKSPEQQQLEKITSSWALQSANSGTDRTQDFDGLVLTVSGSFVNEGGTYNYSFTGTRPNPSPWKENGTWKFGANPTSEIIRDPGSDVELAMTYSVSETSLTIDFVIPSGYECCPGSGRVSSVEGSWTFVFTKQ